VDRGFTHTEASSGLGLRMAGIEICAEIDVGEFLWRYVFAFPKPSLTSD
jgi:hypothetical protein